MFVTAHTNAVGTHLRSAWRREESNGTVYDVPTGTIVPYHNVDADYFITDAESRKPPTYHGDHRTDYDYNRGISRVIEDKPFVLHHHYVNPVDGLTSNYDIYQEKYHSGEYVPFSTDPAFPHGGPLMDNAWDECTTKALNSIAGKGAEVGNALGELKTTVDQLANTAIRGAHFIRAIKRRRWKQAADILGIPRPQSIKLFRGKPQADIWLEYVYGWRPLAQTMYDIHDTFAAAVNRVSNLVEGNGSRTVAGEHDFQYDSKHWKGSWVGQVRCTLKASVTNPQLSLINQLGLTNPVGIAWELVPFSFVVDWFLPVGNTLSACTAGLGLTWHGGRITKRMYKALSVSHNTGYITPWTDCVDGGNYRERSFEFQRVALTGMPYARFYADTTPLSTPRAVNALALIRQLT